MKILEHAGIKNVLPGHLSPVCLVHILIGMASQTKYILLDLFNILLRATDALAYRTFKLKRNDVHLF